MIKKFCTEKGTINYLQVLKTAIFLSLLLVGYSYVSLSVLIPWNVVISVLCCLGVILSISFLHTLLLEIRRIFKSLVLRLYDYHYQFPIEDNEEETVNHHDLMVAPFTLKLLCVFRC
jgi:hypothetical protein